jgi:hypothetical protein
LPHTLTLWTNNVDHARWADKAGVDRVGIDLERLGKAGRQRGLDTWVSRHAIEDLASIRVVLKSARLFVRTDPFHENSSEQVEAMLSEGVEVIMVPNFTTAAELEGMARLIDRRAELVPLVERAAAVEAIVAMPALGITEMHVGLNDLSIDFKLANRLKVLTLPVMDEIAAHAHEAGLKLGVGGLGRAGDRSLPVDSDLIYAQQARLGASAALLARSFFYPDMTQRDFAAEIGRLRDRLQWWRTRPQSELADARTELARQTDQNLS